MILTPTQLDEAEAIARAATQGAWTTDFARSDRDEAFAMGPLHHCDDYEETDRRAQADQDYVARFSPAFALELIEDQKTAIKERDEARDQAREWERQYKELDLLHLANVRMMTEARAEAARYRKLLVDIDFYYGGDTHSGVAKRIRAALDAKTEGGGDVPSK